MYSWSSMAARYKVAVSGKIRPSFFKYLSRANKTVSSIDSYRRKYPIHSEMMISNSCRGSSESSSFPLTRVISWSNCQNKLIGNEYIITTDCFWSRWPQWSFGLDQWCSTCQSNGNENYSQNWKSEWYQPQQHVSLQPLQQTCSRFLFHIPHLTQFSLRTDGRCSRWQTDRIQFV